MYIECFTNNGKPYLRLVESVRVTKNDGKSIPQKRVVKNIGPLDRYDDGQPEFVERLKKSFKAGIPLIPALKTYCEPVKAPEEYNEKYKEGSPECFGHPKLCCNLILERIMEELGLNAFFSSYKKTTKLKFDVYGFFKLLVFGRMLNPASKSATVRQNENYYEPILKDNNPDNVFDTLGFISDNKDKIIKRINTNLVNKAERSPEIIYYDVTNFYFEIDAPDDDILDDEGNVLCKGLRKMGVSKEERKLPIVQTGLFMDDNGIPIGIEAFPGNTLDYQTLRKSLKNNIDRLEFSRFIFIADRGICNGPNLTHLTDAGHGYIVSKSIAKSTKKEREWIYEEKNYINVGRDFKYKSRVVKRSVLDENGNKRVLEEKVVVYWSRKFQKRAEMENKKFLEFLDKLQEHPENFRITAIQLRSLKRFFKKEYVNEDTGEAIHSSKIRAFIDFDKVAAYKKSLGYYQIVTSELTMDAKEVINKYHGLTQIEEQFKIMKSSLKTRPIFVRTPEHIAAHLLICMIALILLSVIQKRIKDSGYVKTTSNLYWSNALSCSRIQDALNKWKVDLLPSGNYRFMDTDDPDLKIILDAFGVNILLKLYSKADLKHIKTQVKVFM